MTKNINFTKHNFKPRSRFMSPRNRDLFNLGYHNIGTQISHKSTMTSRNNYRYSKSYRLKRQDISTFNDSNLETNSSVQSNDSNLERNNTISLSKLGPRIRISYSYISIMNRKLFKDKIIKLVQPNKKYMLLVKLIYEGDLDLNLTLDNKSRFYYKNYSDKKIFDELNEFLVDKITEFSRSYDLYGMNLDSIELSFIDIKLLSTKPIKIPKDLKERLGNKVYQELSKQTAIFEASLKANIREVEVTIKDNKLVDLKLDLLDGELDFIKNIDFNNEIVKPENRININDNLDKCIFGQKIIGNKLYVIKVESLSDNRVRKSAFTTDGILLSSVVDCELSDGSIKRTWKNHTIILVDGNITFISINLE